MLEVFRIIHQIDKIPFNTFFSYNNNPTRGHKWKLDKTRSETRLHLHSFSQRVINPWNDLPTEVVQCTTINCFKNALEKAWESDSTKFEFDWYVNTYVNYFLLISGNLLTHLLLHYFSYRWMFYSQPSRAGYDLKDLTAKEVPLSARVIRGGGGVLEEAKFHRQIISINSITQIFNHPNTRIHYGRHTRHHSKTPRAIQLHRMHLQQHSTKHHSKHKKQHAGNCKHHNQSRGKTNIRHNSTHKHPQIQRSQRKTQNIYTQTHTPIRRHATESRPHHYWIEWTHQDHKQ